MCFVFISEQTATCATYSINWLVFITEVKSVYSAVRTGSLIKQSALRLYLVNSAIPQINLVVRVLAFRRTGRWEIQELPAQWQPAIWREGQIPFWHIVFVQQPLEMDRLQHSRLVPANGLLKPYTVMRRITTFRSTKDRIYDGGPIIQGVSKRALQLWKRIEIYTEDKHNVLNCQNLAKHTEFYLG
jgi:hypothetical protein